MKLGKLNTSIRECKKVRIPFTLPGGVVIEVLVQKTDLIKQLQEAYDKQRATETGLSIEKGFVQVVEEGFSEAASVNKISNPRDFDDLLGDAPSVDDLLA